MADYRTLIVNTAAKFIGTKEPSGDDQFIKAYNKSVGTTFNMQTAWCAMFVTYCARSAGVPTSVIPNFASCTVSINTFWKKKAGTWHPRKTEKNYVPKPGDLIYYDWNGDGNPQHVGLVKAVSGGNVITIEGNTSDPDKKSSYDGVYSKKYALTSKYIHGFAEPPYPALDKVPNATETKVSSLVKGTYVKTFQTWLNDNTALSTKLAVDGIFGTNSRTAAIKSWQAIMNANYKSKLTTDGVWKPACRTAANKHILRKNARGKQVYILQGLLYAHGYDPKGFDGIAGANTINAVKAFQKARHLEVDGEVGPDTWESLFTRW